MQHERSDLGRLASTLAGPGRWTELNRRYRLALRIGFVVSLLLHVVLVLWFRAQVTPVSPFAAAGPRAGDDRAAPGGGLEAINVRTQQPNQPIIRPPEPLIVPDLALEQVQAQEPLEQPTFEEMLAGSGMGPVLGPGRPDGTGRGDGGTADEGRFRVVPPSPRGMILPPSDRPRTVRGKEVAVWVFVTESGRVVGDSTRLRPGTGDRGFDAQLRRQASEWVFEPARRGGQPVAQWYQYVISL